MFGHALVTLLSIMLHFTTILLLINNGTLCHVLFLTY